MIQKTLLFLACTAVLISGCSDDSTVVETAFTDSAIMLNDMQLSHYAVDTDTVDVVTNTDKSADDPISIPLGLQVSVSNSDRVSSLRYQVRLDGKSAVLQEGPLQRVASTQHWSAAIAFDRKRGDVGDYRIDVIGVDDAGIYANSAHAKFRVLFGSRAPVILAVNAPDTISLQLQTVVIFMSAEVEDESGLADIKTVYFNSFLPDGRPSSGNPFTLRDDGQPGSGDVSAGDGLYSVKIQMPPGTIKGEYRFEFRALDYSGLSSNVVIHKLIVR